MLTGSVFTLFGGRWFRMMSQVERHSNATTETPCPTVLSLYSRTRRSDKKIASPGRCLPRYAKTKSWHNRLRYDNEYRNAFCQFFLASYYFFLARTVARQVFGANARLFTRTILGRTRHGLVTFFSCPLI